MLERQLQQWIMRVCIEAPRDQKQIGFESNQFGQSGLCDIDNLISRCEWSDRIVMDVRKRSCAGSGIRRELVDRRKSNSAVVGHDCFGSVAVVPIKIPNGNAFSAAFQCVESSDTHIAEITEAHRAIARRVMSRRSHQAKSQFAPQCCACRLDGGASRVARVYGNVRIKWRVEIEFFPCSANALKMLT